MKPNFSSPEGQRELCREADARATAFMMADYLRKRGIPTYSHAFIASLNLSTLAAVKAELLADYNLEASKPIA